MRRVLSVIVIAVIGMGLADSARAGQTAPVASTPKPAVAAPQAVPSALPAVVPPATPSPVAQSVTPVMPPAPPPPARPSQARGQAATPPPAPPAPAAARPATPPAPPDPAQLVNVRVELTISEARGTGLATQKTVLLLTASQTRGSVRSSMPRAEGGSMSLNVDARPYIQKDGRISLEITFGYTPERSPDPADANRVGDINEQMTVFLTDGKAMQISQSADPKGERKVAVSVTATIVK